MRKDALDFLRCPKCGRELSIKTIFQTKDKEIISGTLICISCGSTYPIKSGVPDMVQEMDRGVALTERSYNIAHVLEEKKWKCRDYIKRRVKTLLDHLEISPEDLKGKKILDAGCGGGQLACKLSSFNCDVVVGIDICRIITRAFDNCRRKSVHYVRGDIMNIPIREKYFDVIYCLDVFPILPNPEKAFDNLSRLIREGGVLFITFINSNSDILFWKIMYPTWRILSRLPLSIQDVLSYLFAVCFVLVSSFKRRKFSKNFFNEGRVLYYDMFGQGYYYTEDPKEVRKWFIKNGFRKIEIKLGSAGFRAYARGIK